MKTEETKQKIQKTFFSLSQKIPLKKITVSKLCQACQISRSTFYLHYDNVDDLTDYLEKELLYHIEKILKQEQHIPLEDLQNQTFFNLLVYMESHKQSFLFFISKESKADFYSKLSIMLENILSNRLQTLGLLKEEHAITITFFSSGILKLMITQIEKPAITPQKMCAIYNELLMNIFKNPS